MKKGRLHPLVLAGGSGTRFWPLSRQDRPKQFLPLTSDEPLLLETLTRIEGLYDQEDALVVCGSGHAAEVERLLPALGAGLLVEPAPRSTAPAIGLAALQVAAKDPEGILLVLPSDHAIGDVEAFRDAIEVGAAAARAGALTTIGIRPTRPETGFGYLKVGSAHPSEKRARKVLAFVEKPDRRKAESYLRAGEYLWNAGIFLFRADRILEELARHAPDVVEALEKIRPTVGTEAYAAAVDRWFSEAPAISIDYAVMEKSASIAVVPATIGWSDLGSLSALEEIGDPDEDGNVVTGDALALRSTGNVVVAGEGKTVVLVGCSDLVVVDTADALVVCPKDRAQEVRDAVAALKARGDDHLL